jgi:Ca-activated chloride channel family protein
MISINRLRQFLTASLLIALAAPSLSAQTAAPTTSSTFGESISVGYVLIPFVATDARGRSIRNIRQRDVSLMVEGRKVVTDMFERTDNAPASFTILLDGSGSMGLEGKMDSAKAAVRALMSKMVKGDDYALYVFSSQGVHEVVPFTHDASKILRAMDIIVPFGTTAFYDALSVMPDKTILGENGSRAIILLTDGLDNASKITRHQLTRSLEGVDVPVYPLGLRITNPPIDAPVDPEGMTDIETLVEIARVTGGRVAIGADPLQLEQAVTRIGEDLRSQYLIGFTPTGRGGVKYRPISLKVAGSNRVVRVRAGYRGTEPPAQTTRRRQAARADKSRKRG